MQFVRTVICTDQIIAVTQDDIAGKCLTIENGDVCYALQMSKFEVNNKHVSISFQLFSAVWALQFCADLCNHYNCYWCFFQFYALYCYCNSFCWIMLKHIGIKLFAAFVCYAAYYTCLRVIPYVSQFIVTFQYKSWISVIMYCRPICFYIILIINK